MLPILASAGTPLPVSAQSGKDEVACWDDPDEDSSSADVPAPADGHPDGVLLNPNGGRTTTDGLLVAVSHVGVQVIRGRDRQIYDDQPKLAAEPILIATADWGTPLANDAGLSVDEGEEEVTTRARCRRYCLD